MSEDTFRIDECEEAFVRDFCPYKGNPDPLTVWRAAWKSSRAAATAPADAHAAWSAFERLESDRSQPTDEGRTAIVRDFLMQAARVGKYRPDLAATAPAGGVTDNLQIRSWLETAVEALNDGGQGHKALAIKNINKARAALTAAARAAEPARLDLSGLQRYRLSKQWHTMNRDPEGPYVQWDAVVALAATPTPPTGAARAAEPEGLPVTQEPKYTVNGTHIVNRASGEAIPHDEPVFIFRARDVHALRALHSYAARIGGSHFEAVRARIGDFQLFATQHPQRMKEPDTAASPTPPTGTSQPCEGCNGHGMVGGLRPDGYDMQECPFCKGDGTSRTHQVEPEVIQFLRDKLEDARAKRRHRVDINLYTRRLQAILDALTLGEPPKPGEGWCVVPRVPNAEMLYQADDLCNIHPPRLKRLWPILIAASRAAEPGQGDAG